MGTKPRGIMEGAFALWIAFVSSCAPPGERAGRAGRDGGGADLDGASPIMSADGARPADVDGGEIDPSLCPPSSSTPPGCMGAADESAAGLCNSLDDDCDGAVDERCPCEVGTVQPCFAGGPGRRGVGACSDGAQTCVANGEFAGLWGTCEGGFSGASEVCDGLDNDCNGCTDEISDCVPESACPAPGDPRVPDGAPFRDYRLRGGDFFPAATVSEWSWHIEGGPCDAVLPRPSFSLEGVEEQDAVFRPTLSGDYRVTLTITTSSGVTSTCSWVVHVAGPGLRVEMCYPESEALDADLYLARHDRAATWFRTDQPRNIFSPSFSSCGWHNCEARIRQPGYRRPDWGYPNSPLDACEGSPLGAQWAALGYCANPRLDIDNNLMEGTGVAENINVDQPRDGDRFRIMVQNFSGPRTRPIVNIYCSGRRVATYGAEPDVLPAFAGTSGRVGWGAMWRVADVTTRVDGGDVICEVDGLHPPGRAGGYWVTNDDAAF